MVDVKPAPVRFTEAIDFLKKKVAIPTEAWTDLWQSMNSVGFVVAGANTEALVSDFQEAIVQAAENGTTLQQFRQDFNRIVSEHGWQYRGSPGWRSRVIYETNLRTAFAAGNWAKIQRLKHVRPYLRYVTVGDERVRPEHRKWHNVVLRVEDPWWNTHFPPCGWGCRCRVVSLNERDLTRYGLKVWDEAPEIKYVAREVKTPDGPVMVQVPEGIDPGFDYNPGQGQIGRGTESLALEKHGKWIALRAPGEVTRSLEPLPIDTSETPAGPAATPGDPDSFRAAFRAALGGKDEDVLIDPTGAGIRIGQAIVDHILESANRQDGRERYFPLLPELIKDPAEIWIGFAENSETGRTAMRRRYVRLFDLGKGTTIGVIADADVHELSGVTFFRGSRTGAKKLRSGVRIYKRK